MNEEPISESELIPNSPIIALGELMRLNADERQRTRRQKPFEDRISEELEELGLGRIPPRRTRAQSNAADQAREPSARQAQGRSGRTGACAEEGAEGSARSGAKGLRCREGARDRPSDDGYSDEGCRCHDEGCGSFKESGGP